MNPTKFQSHPIKIPILPFRFDNQLPRLTRTLLTHACAASLSTSAFQGCAAELSTGLANWGTAIVGQASRHIPVILTWDLPTIQAFFHG